MMFLLIRKISPYSGADICLGVFVHKEDAQKAQETYINHYLANPSSDPWLEQAYSDGDHLADGELIIQPIEGSYKQGKVVYVVSRYFDGMGQLCREIDSLLTSAEEAKARCAVLNDDEEDDDSEFGFPEYAEYQQFHVGEMGSDKPEDQPAQ